MANDQMRRSASRISLMFVLGVILAFSHITDANAMTKRDAAAATMLHGYHWCAKTVPKGFVCRYKVLAWHVRHTTEVFKRRAGGFGFERAFSKLRFAYAKPNAKYGIEMGCTTIVQQQTFAVFMQGPIHVRCENPRRPKLIGMVRLLGNYY